MNTGSSYDFLIVGAGLYGSVFAREAAKHGKTSLVIDRRSHVGGNIYTENIAGINVHMYGPHIFHTDNEEVWNYVQEFAEFNHFINTPKANYRGRLYSLPFSMYTFTEMWGVTAPEEASAIIEEQRQSAGVSDPENLEEQAIDLVGTDIYEKLIKGYSQKQWGRECRELPAFLIRRLPVRFTYDDSYYNSRYQGIPAGGYTGMIERILDDPLITVRVGTDFFDHREELESAADMTIYTGPIDAYFDFCLGRLEYRSVRFEKEILDTSDYQGYAVINYTDAETPWTRIIEHKWFEYGRDENGKDIPGTVISREYCYECGPDDEPFYPLNDELNTALHEEYAKLAAAVPNVVFGGRLGEYKYYDMDQVIVSALDKAREIL